MNLKTTLTLVLLAVAGGASWLVYHYRQPSAPPSATLTVLERELTPAKLAKIEVRRGDRTVELRRGGAGDWSLPGNWPTRQPEVKELVSLLTGLRSRFAPLPLGEPATLADYGLETPAATVIVLAGGKDYRLHFGEEPGDNNRFSRPTYLRLNDEKEVIRLAPGLVSILDRPADYYQQRRLFPGTITKQADSGDRVERVAARALTAEGPDGKYSLRRDGDDWSLRAPVVDRADPDKVKTILAAVPDVWAEQFSAKTKKDLAACGLDKPRQTLTVKTEKGEELTLQIGQRSQMKVRTVTKPAPPSPRGFPQSLEPSRETVHEEYLFAKLKDNDQIFEIRADKLKDLFVAPNTLRDDRLARFRTEDARKVEISHGGDTIVLAKDKERWKLQKPAAGDAEATKVTELLDKLSLLSARDQDIIDKADPKKYGFDAPSAVVQVTVEESQGEGDKKTTKAKAFTFTLGKTADDKQLKPKLYVRVDQWERVNAVEDGLGKLAGRPALAYRGRRVLDFPSGDLAKVEVQRGQDKYVLERAKGDWKLTAPEPAAADASKASSLASDLSLLEAAEFVNDAPKPDDLEKVYGLAKPALTATLTFTKSDQKPRKLLVGKPRGDKEYFAKLDGAPGVFVIKKDVHDALAKSSLAFLPLQLWQLPPTEIAELRFQRGDDAYRLKRDGSNWRIAEPFEAATMMNSVQPLVDEVSNLRTERYEAHAAKQLANYGLDKPYVRLVVVPAAKKEGDKDKKKEETKDAKERVLLIGKPTAAGAKTRYAKLGDGEAVFVVSEKLAAAADHGPLDLLDRQVLAIDPKSVASIKTTANAGTLTFEQKANAWQVAAPAARFPADAAAINQLLAVWSGLRAERFAAYGPKVDLAAYGLDKPSATVQISVKKSAAKPEEHRLMLGKPVTKDGGERFARLDNGPGVFVLNAAAARPLTRGYLDYVDHSVLKFDPATVSAVRRDMAGKELELTKSDDGWKIAKPQALTADAQILDDLVQQLGSLRAERVAGFPVKDLTPFGLDRPAAVVKVQAKTAEGKAVKHVLKVGTARANGDYLAQVDGSPKVVVLPKAVATRLLAEPIKFRDRLLARFADVERIILERGPRRATFTKVDGTWKMTSPVNAEAEQTDLDDFINALSRLRADELVAEKADDKPYGLDKPETRWRFLMGDKEVLALAVGAAERGMARNASETRRYAKRAGSDLVFLLSPKMTGQALKEYRSRSVWASLDSAQVETVRYNYRRNPFVLEKSGTNWKVAGKPEVAVKSEAVSEALDALARLQAERYVVDKDADLKLYGLAPPELALELQIPAGKRTLHVGRPEGDSKRYYARVGDGTRYDVFIISEADAGRIVRDLAAFTQPAKPAKSAPKPR
jgi:hypothetical protein